MKNQFFFLASIFVVGVWLTFTNTSCSTVKTLTATSLTTPSLKDTQDTLQLYGKATVFNPTKGKLVDSLRIEAMDKSFVLKGGETFDVSFWTEGWINPSKEFAKAFNKSTKGKKVKIIINRKKPIYEISQEIVKDPVTKQDKVREVKKVIGIKDYQEVMYGLLEFNSVHKICSNDPTTRAYYISIAEKYIEAARGGNISVVYEYYNCTPIKHSNSYTTWVMWLSDIPF